MTTPYLPEPSLTDTLRSWIESRYGPVNLPPLKPEPSMATLGRAKAKETGLPYVSPRLSVAYAREKSGFIDTRGLPTTIPRQPADDTAAPLTAHMVQWLRGRA